MNFCLITFRSVTPAQRGEQLLKRAGLVCQLQRTPRWMEKQGCGYSLRVPYQQAMQSKELLKQKGISFRKLYLVGNDDTYEELVL